MVYYVVESDTQNITPDKIRLVVKSSGYDELLFAFAEYEFDRKKVKITPNSPLSPILPPTTLQHTAKKDYGLTITVNPID
jgi:hypothetical protein